MNLVEPNPAGAAALVSDCNRWQPGRGRVEALGSPIDSLVVLAVAYRVAGDLVRDETNAWRARSWWKSPIANASL